MKDLSKVIVSLFRTTNSFNTAIGGRLFYEYAEQGTAFPYAIYSYPIINTDTLLDGTEVDEVLWQLNIYSNEVNPGSILDLYEKAVALFDQAELVLNDGTFYSMIRDTVTNMYDTKDRVRAVVLRYDIMKGN